MEKKADGLDIQVALKNREFELSLFWQRSNYFLVLNTALGVAAFSSSTKAVLGVLIALFGVLVAFLWYRTNLGSRFWQVFWETEVARLAPAYGLESFELSTEEATNRVRQDIQSRKPSFWRGIIDKGVLEKPSVTVHMIALSFAAILLWTLLLVYFACQLAIPASQTHPRIDAPAHVAALPPRGAPQAPPATPTPHSN